MSTSAAPPPPSFPPMNAPPPMRVPTSVILVNIPPFLHSPRAIRDWIFACGNLRSVVFMPEPNEDQEATENELPVTAVLSLFRPDSALRLLTAFRQFKSMLQDDTFQSFQIHSVPVNPDIPLPPASMEPTAVQTLAEKLLASFEAWKNGEKNESTAPNITNVEPEEASRDKAEGDGADDEEADPLEAPQVQEAVREFRRRLEHLQGSKATRRKELVASSLEQILPLVRQRMESGLPPPGFSPPPPPTGADRPPMPHEIPPGLPPGITPGNLPAPPMPSGAQPPLPPPPMPSGVPPPFMPSSGGLPPPPPPSGEPPAKRIKLDPSLSFPSLAPSTHARLREFIAAQCKQYLGEEEQTLIDFVFRHVLECKTAELLLPELKEVLEEEAEPFLNALWEKVQEFGQVN